jgi:hypothetical protein
VIVNPWLTLARFGWEEADLERIEAPEEDR